MPFLSTTQYLSFLQRLESHLNWLIFEQSHPEFIPFLICYFVTIVHKTKLHVLLFCQLDTLAQTSAHQFNCFTAILHNIYHFYNIIQNGVFYPSFGIHEYRLYLPLIYKNIQALQKPSFACKSCERKSYYCIRTVFFF